MIGIEGKIFLYFNEVHVTEIKNQILQLKKRNLRRVMIFRLELS